MICARNINSNVFGIALKVMFSYVFLFVVFGDMTNGAGTYPGGRFLTTDPPAADGTVVLDFNRAYNPPCVFSEYATCPLPGLENRLLIAVTAGEKMWSAGR